jgi:hypothetical protein
MAKMSMSVVTSVSTTGLISVPFGPLDRPVAGEQIRYDEMLDDFARCAAVPGPFLAG